MASKLVQITGVMTFDDPSVGGGGPVDPGYGRPGWSPVDPGFGTRPPVDPGYGRPVFGGGRPDNSLPTPPGSTLPIYPGNRPDNSLPKPPGGGGRPGNPIANDELFELRYSVRYGWVLVPVGGDDTAPAPEPPPAEPKV